MTYSKKMIESIIAKTKILMKNDYVASRIIRHSNPTVTLDTDERGHIYIKEIRFVQEYGAYEKGDYVSVNAGGVYVSPKKAHYFDCECWEEFLALDENMMTIDMLETGMLVTTAENKHYLVMRDTRVHADPKLYDRYLDIGMLIEIGGDDWVPMRDYRDDMQSKWPTRQHKNIMKVFLIDDYTHGKPLSEMTLHDVWTRTPIAADK